MTIKKIYNQVVDNAIETDFRSREEIEQILKKKKEEFDDLSDEKQSEFDQEKLSNPYADTRILAGDLDTEVEKVLVGIDIDPAELLIADKLGDIDLVISHHPRGKALAGLDEVMKMQADILASYGVPINIAEGLLKKKMKEVGRGVSAANHNRSVDAAKLLDLPFMCTHTAADNLVADFLQKKVEQGNFKYVKEVLEMLKKIPEYKRAIDIKAGPQLFSGSKNNRAGKIAITEITGGTEGNPEIYERLAQAGVGTIIGMHMSEEHTKKAKNAHINAVIAGHMASDSIGMNLLLDELEKEGIEIIATSGLFRVSRNENNDEED